MYFRKMIKFHDLKVKAVPQVLFVLLLAISFGIRIAARPIVIDYSIYLQQMANTYSEIMSSQDLRDPSAMLKIAQSLQESAVLQNLLSSSLKIIGIFILQRILLMLVSYFYLGAYLCDHESENSSLSCYIGKYKKALTRFVGFNLIFYSAIIFILFAGLFILSFAAVLVPVLILPIMLISYLLPAGWFILQVIFIFKDITFLDTGVTIWRNFKLSTRLSAGNRLIIGVNIFFISFLNVMIGMFTVESQLISMFIISFLEVIIILVRQRLVALMYLSRTRRVIAPPAEG